MAIALVKAVADALQGDTGPLDEIFDIEHFIRRGSPAKLARTAT